MKLSEYIEYLTNFMNINGDLECFYSSDNEGNSYQRVSYAGTLFFTREPEKYSPELYSKDDIEEDDEDCEEFTKVCVIN